MAKKRPTPEWHVRLECRVGDTLLQLIEYPKVTALHWEVHLEDQTGESSTYYNDEQEVKARAHYDELKAQLGAQQVLGS